MTRLGCGLALAISWLVCGCSGDGNDPQASGSGAGGEATGSPTAGPSGPGSGGATASGAATGTGTGGVGGSAPACTPMPGDSIVDVGCDEVEIAILAHRGKATRAQLSGRLSGAEGACIRVTSVDVMGGSQPVQTLDVSATAVVSGQSWTWGEADAAGAVSAPCEADAPRVEAFGVIARGQIDGGTFEAKCGKADFGSGWPPRVLLTCHEGIDGPPTGSYAQVQVNGQFTTADFYGLFSSPPTVTSVGGDVHVIPATWMGPPMAPFDTSGWGASVSPAQADLVDVAFHQLGDPFGEEVCPVPPPNPMPGDDPPPMFLARVTGQTDAGAFSSEIFVGACMRVVQ